MRNVLVVLIVLYYAAVMLYLGLALRRSRGLAGWTSKGCYQAAMALCLPFVGLPAVLLSERLSRSTRRLRDGGPEDPFVGSRSDILYKSNFQEEKDIVPIEEALILNENNIKRELLIEALKTDFYESTYFLKKAVADKDTETSHYAAAALMELKSQLTKELQQTAVQYEKNKQNPEALKDYFHALRRYLHSDVADAGRRNLYENEYLVVLEKLLEIEPQVEGYYELFLQALLAQKQYAWAENVCEKYLRRMPDREKPYLFYIKLYYLMGQRAMMSRYITMLRSSPVKLSAEALNIVRFWISEGEPNGK